MLDRVKIKGFQVHEDLDVRLDPQITTIIGETDTGKSSIIRAIRWLVLNQPRGDGYINTGTKQCSVRARVDGTIFKRVKGGKTNTYTLGKDKVFKAFGNDVPPEIQGLLCISDLNFQMQHDAPFWFSLSAAEVGRQLNKIVDLEQIDRMATKLNGRVRALRSEVTVVEKRLGQAEERIKESEFAIEMEEELASLETLQGRIQTGKRKEAALSKLITEAVLLKQKKKKADKLVSDARNVIEIGDQCVKLSGQHSVLEALLLSVVEIKSKVQAEIPNIEKIEALKNARNDLVSKRESLVGFMSTVNSAVKELSLCKENAVYAQEELEEEFDGTCPVCGSKWDG